MKMLESLLSRLGRLFGARRGKPTPKAPLAFFAAAKACKMPPERAYYLYELATGRKHGRIA